jgi:hypothetical protein
MYSAEERQDDLAAAATEPVTIDAELHSAPSVEAAGKPALRPRVPLI